MKLEEHEQDCIAKLGAPYTEVHQWLDEFAGSPEYGMKHRRKRHHQAGIKEVRQLFGDDAAEAARIHIEADLRQEGYMDEIPRDEQHYVSIGLY
jgi:hypothetical protein